MVTGLCGGSVCFVLVACWTPSGCQRLISWFKQTNPQNTSTHRYIIFPLWMCRGIYIVISLILPCTRYITWSQINSVCTSFPPVPGPQACILRENTMHWSVHPSCRNAGESIGFELYEYIYMCLCVCVFIQTSHRSIFLRQRRKVR